MDIINAIAGALVQAALYPFRGLPPMVGLTVFSLVSGVGMLYVFKWTSDQKRLAEVKRKIHAGIFEIRLFNDDMRAILAAQRDILRHNLTYLRLSLRPLLWMIVPFVLIVAQLQLHYGYEGPEVGEPFIVKVRLVAGEPAGDGAGQLTAVGAATGAAATGGATTAAAGQAPGAARAAVPELAIQAPDGLRVDTPRLWIPTLNEADWRLVATAPGEYELTIRVGGNDYGKTVTVGDAILARSPIRTSGLLDRILYPGESAFPSGSEVASIEVLYPEREVSFFGWRTHWLVPFIIITIVLAFALRRPLGVTF
jgi:hypothetical protein